MIRGARLALKSGGPVSRMMKMSTEAEAPLLMSMQGGAAIALLNRPKALNALVPEICTDLNEHLVNWDSNPSTAPGAMVMKGVGGKAFCAGGDVKAMWSDAMDGGESLGSGTYGRPSADFFYNEYIMNYYLGISKVPQVSLWDGIVMGGGVGISIFGEYRIATEKTMFAMPETSIGLFPDVGSSAWLPHIGHGLGEYLALTGVRLTALDLLELGLATHFVSSDKVGEFEQRVVSSAVKGSPEKSRAAINALLVELGSSGLQGIDTTTSVFGSDRVAGRARVGACFHNKASVENIITSLQTLGAAGNEDDKAWAVKTLKSLSQCSPTSLKVTLAQLQRGRTLDLKACLEMEFRISQGCMRSPDFREGVRALLVDKDKNPKWNPPTLEEVPQALVDAHFLPLSVRELVLPPSNSGLMGGGRTVISTKY